MTRVNVLGRVVPVAPSLSAGERASIALTFLVTMVLCAGFLWWVGR